MVGLFNLGTRAVSRFGSLLVDQDHGGVNRRLVELSNLSDDQLDAQVQQALAGSPATPLTDRAPSFSFGGFARRVVRRKGPSRLTLHHLALGVEAFARAPADLPRGSRLFPEQIQVALAVAQRSIVQMDTGEGKTYALLPAAFALACEFDRVYVVCASDYLATRDHRRTSAYWQRLGIHCGLCLGADDSQQAWSPRIIYTTLRTLMFRILSDQVSPNASWRRITPGAALLDEADAILLDQADREFFIHAPRVAPGSHDWTFALNFATRLAAGVDVNSDRVECTGSLTDRGEQQLLAALPPDRRSGPEFLIERKAVELAFVATRVAQENVDYVIDAGDVVRVDRASGRLERGVEPAWFPPLRHARGLRPHGDVALTHKASPRHLLTMFRHVAGVSGTVTFDALEYLLAFSLPLVVVKPRRQRFAGPQRHLLCLDTANACRVAASLAAGAVTNGRPVLVGTQSISTAEKVHGELRRLAPNARLSLVTGTNDSEMHAVFEAAGETGSVVVATQLAGRGVDIRLTEQAHGNGGLALIGLGRTPEKRHELQFVGRAGRQGAPYSIHWISSTEDEIWRRTPLLSDRQGLAGQLIAAMDGVEAPILGRRVEQVQRELRALGIVQRWQSREVDHVRDVMLRSFTVWFDYLQPVDDSTHDQCPNAFLDFALDDYLARSVPAARRGAGGLSSTEAARIVSAINADLALDENDCLRASMIEGHGRSDAVRLLHGKLREVLGRCADLNAQARARAGEEWALRARAANTRQFIAGWLDWLDELLRSGEQTELLLPGRHARLAVPPAPVGLGSIDVDLRPVLEPFVAGGRWKREGLVSARDTLAAYDDRLTRQIRDVFSRVESAEVILPRTPRAAARWALLWPWMEMLEKDGRIRHKAFHDGLVGIERVRSISERLFQAWRNCEEQLAQRVLGALIRCRDPGALDQLFSLQVAGRIDVERMVPKVLVQTESSVSAPAPPRPGSKPLDQEELIERFLAGRGPQTDVSKYDQASIRRLLIDFSRQFPAHVLQTPDRIERALKAWAATEADRDVETGRRKLHRQWLGSYLLFLRESGLVGPLPRLENRLRVAFRDWWAGVSSPETVLPALGIAVFVTAFVAASRVELATLRRPLGVVAALFDALVAGQLWSAGALTAIAFPALLLASCVLNRPVGSSRGQAADRLLSWLALIALAVVFVRPRLHTWREAAVEVALAVLLMLVGRTVHLTAWLLDNLTGVWLVSGWLCYCAIRWVVNVAPRSDAGGVLFLIVFSAAVAFQVLMGRLNVHRIRIVTNRQRSTTVGFENEAAIHNFLVPGDAGFAPHVAAAILSVASRGPLESLLSVTGLDGRLLPVAVVAVYLVVVVVCVWRSVAWRLDENLWRRRLNMRSELIDGVDPGDRTAVGRVLLKAARRLQWRATAVQTGVGVAVAASSWELRIGGNSVTSVIVAMMTVQLLAIAASDFARQLWAFFVQRRPAGTQVLDLSMLPAPERPKTLWGKFQQAKKSRAVLIFSTILIALKLFSVISQGVMLLKTWLSSR